MDFTLFYDGPLPASKGRLEQRHHIRVALHPQLQELWQHHPLRDIDPPPNRTVNGHSYSSIVHSKWNFRARLEILLLKPEPPGRIVTQGGDIDNRLKNLFDALTVPIDPSNVPVGWSPGPGQDPLCCLLEDDSLIAGVSVETDRLLSAASGTHVRLTIKVRIQTAGAFGGFGLLV